MLGIFGKKSHRDTKAQARSFLREKKGAAAIEFALIAPVFVGLLLGSTAFTQWLWVDGKLSESTSIIGDLVAQETVLDNSRFDELLSAGPLLIQPYDPASLTMEVVSAIACYQDGDDTTGDPIYYATWSRKYAGGGSVNGSFEPGDVFSEGVENITIRHDDSIVVVMTNYTYKPDITYKIGTTINIDKLAHYQPRASERVLYDGIDADPPPGCATFRP